MHGMEIFYTPVWRSKRHMLYVTFQLKWLIFCSAFKDPPTNLTVKLVSVVLISRVKSIVMIRFPPKN